MKVLLRVKELKFCNSTYFKSFLYIHDSFEGKSCLPKQNNSCVVVFSSIYLPKDCAPREVFLVQFLYFHFSTTKKSFPHLITRFLGANHKQCANHQAISMLVCYAIRSVPLNQFRPSAFTECHTYCQIYFLAYLETGLFIFFTSN